MSSSRPIGINGERHSNASAGRFRLAEIGGPSSTWFAIGFCCSDECLRCDIEIHRSGGTAKKRCDELESQVTDVSRARHLIRMHFLVVNPSPFFSDISHSSTYNSLSCLPFHPPSSSTFVLLSFCLQFYIPPGQTEIDTGSTQPFALNGSLSTPLVMRYEDGEGPKPIRL